MSWLDDHWVDILGWGGSALLVFSLLQARVLRFRALNLAATLILLLFNAVIEVWPMVGMNTVLAVINVVFIVRLLQERHDDESSRWWRSAPATTTCACAGHARRRHPQVPARFRLGSGPPGSHAFVLVKRDETVGVVLLRRPTATSPRIELDYVTPKYRDFSPGEFVWRRSGVLKDRGIRRVLTPPGMMAAYYENVGFRRKGDRYALDL